MMQTVKELLSPKFKSIEGVLMVLQKTHAEILEIYNSIEREILDLWKKN